jgi:hypothetical protein
LKNAAFMQVFRQRLQLVAELDSALQFDARARLICLHAVPAACREVEAAADDCGEAEGD